MRDPTCSAVDEQYLQFRAVIWGPGRRQIQELPPLPGDSASAATAINDRGQVVGISGDCDRAFGRFSAIHSVLWEDGVPTNIGDLGGVAWNTPVAINRRGDIVGFSNTSPADGGSFRAQAFLKLAGEPIQNLGTISPDETLSQALGINEQRQVVGISCTPGFASCRAFIWEDGVMRDLNGLVQSRYPDHLFTANDINDLGQITGRAIDQSGAEFPFVATPVDDDDDDAGSAAARDLPESARQKLMARFGIHETRPRPVAKPPLGGQWNSLVQADEIPVGGLEHCQTPTRDVDDSRGRVPVRDLGRADLGQRAVGDLAQGDGTGRNERPVRLLDLSDLPEDERMVDPGG